MAEMIPNAHTNDDGVVTCLNDEQLARVEALMRARLVVADDSVSFMTKSAKLTVSTGDLVYIADYILGSGEEEELIDPDDIDAVMTEMIDLHGSTAVLESARRVIEVNQDA